MPIRRLFALSDPHLSFGNPKPMDIFGPHWRDHAERLAVNWKRAVGPGDVVLVPGDISWGMRLSEAVPDLEWLAALPGEKVMVKGNHDYWWSSPAKLRALGLPGMHFIQNNHVVLGGLAVGGSRLWDFPGIFWPFAGDFDAADASLVVLPGGKAVKRETGVDAEKIRAREIDRLSASLRGLPRGAEITVALTHFPPLGEDGEPTPLTDLIGGFGVDFCVFGHVHGPRDPAQRRPGEDIVIGKTRYVLASGDFLGHAPKLLADFE